MPFEKTEKPEKTLFSPEQVQLTRGSASSTPAGQRPPAQRTHTEQVQGCCTACHFPQELKHTGDQAENQCVQCGGDVVPLTDAAAQHKASQRGPGAEKPPLSSQKRTSFPRARTRKLIHPPPRSSVVSAKATPPPDDAQTTKTPHSRPAIPSSVSDEDAYEVATRLYGDDDHSTMRVSAQKKIPEQHKRGFFLNRGSSSPQLLPPQRTARWSLLLMLPLAKRRLSIIPSPKKLIPICRGTPARSARRGRGCMGGR